MKKCRLENDRLCPEPFDDVQDTIVSPVNWVYSIHNFLVARDSPDWLLNRFSLKSPISLAIFTVVDMVLKPFGRGTLLNAFFSKPSMSGGRPAGHDNGDMLD